jgi:hypothetical protein
VPQSEMQWLCIYLYNTHHRIVIQSR